MIKKKIIYGCDSRGDGNSPYLTRWTLLSSKLGAVYIHKFHRSDSVEMHDHPWAFASLILWRGYFEETSRVHKSWLTGNGALNPNLRFRRRMWPGMLLFRKATHQHRVVLVDCEPAWTLVVRGPYVREWGFFTRKGWQQWREYFKERGC